MTFRGSRKHILDLTASSGFVETINNLLVDTGASLSKTNRYQPCGYSDVEEWTLRRFCREYCKNWFDFEAFNKWWVPDQYRNPQWDLLSTCTVDNKSGLLMIEAKANVNEIKMEGKVIPDEASEQTRLNHKRIKECIEEADKDLKLRYNDVNISHDTHYQLSNRVASAWKLAQCGLSTVLLYLGFTGDEGIRDAGEPFADNNHWQQIMKTYIHGILPQHFPNQITEFDSGATMRMIIRSLPVIENSPPVNTT